VTNASKYGALTGPQGRISVRWDLREDRAPAGLSLEWIETGGPLCRLSNQPGYGTRAIRSLIPYELGGTVDLAFEADGLRCKIELPAACIGTDAQRAAPPMEPVADWLSVATLPTGQSR
jgi:two-component sensor histidine kinase